jgi:hypothetical protein
MTTITIPKELIKRGEELVMVPRKIYEELIEFKKKMASTYTPTKTELRMFKHARENFKNGKFIEWTKLRDELDNYHRRPRRKTTQKIPG